MHWSTNAQYHYGWFVPLLALYAGFNRWQTRPLPDAPLAQGRRWAILLSVAILPVWLLYQPSPEWPLLNWLLAVLIVGQSMAAVGAIGGRSWVRHFTFPICFILVAVPWPEFVEKPIMQGMMRAVASVSVSFLDVLGITAIQHGNLIEVATGTVGVSEACSGIRSFQGSLMASFFLGELFHFPRNRRLLLIVASVAVAFITNIFRAAFLAWNAAHSGVQAVEQWHDPAGFTILLICVAFIFGLTLLLDRGIVPPVMLRKPPFGQALPFWWSPALGCWLALTVVGAELWYYDPAKPPESPWSLVPPASSHPVEIPAAALDTFHADRVTSATWDESPASWLLYFFEWNYGPAFTRLASQMHRPDICLPASGYELQKDRGEVSFDIGGTVLPFHAYLFTAQGRPFYIYHGVWQFRSARGLSHGPLSFHKQIAAVQSMLWRERRMGQQVAEIAITGYANETEADTAFQAGLTSLLHRR